MNCTFRASVAAENCDQIISRLTPPTTVEIYHGVTVDLDYHGWPSLGKGAGDTVYAVSSMRTEHVDPYGAIGFSKSLDGGKTWEPYRIIMDTPLDDRDCGIVSLGSGHLMVWWFTHDAYKYREGGCFSGWRNRSTPEQIAAVDARFDTLTEEEAIGGCFVSHSMDDGKTWGAPIRLPITCPHGASLMQDGKSLVAVGMPWYSKKTLGVDLDPKQLHVVMSQDGGYHWDLISSIPTPDTLIGGACEPHIIQLKDGSFLASLRDQSKTAMKCWVARSEDGKSWGEFEIVPAANGAPPHLLQLKDGKVLLVYSCRIAPACGERACVSTDGGKTWSNEMILSVAKQAYHWDLGYPSSVELDDGTILTAYYQKLADDKKCSFLYTKWKLIED